MLNCDPPSRIDASVAPVVMLGWPLSTYLARTYLMKSRRLDRENIFSRRAIPGANTMQTPRRKKLKHYRDKVVAHTAVRELPVPLVSELTSYAMGTADALARLARGTGVTTQSQLGVQTAAYDESAKAFWSVWRDRMKSR